MKKNNDRARRKEEKHLQRLIDDMKSYTPGDPNVNRKQEEKQRIVYEYARQCQNNDRVRADKLKRFIEENHPKLESFIITMQNNQKLVIRKANQKTIIFVQVSMMYKLICRQWRQILHVICIFLISYVLGFLLSCDILDYKPKGRCVYGPPGYKVCINGTYEDECKDDFKGSWYEGEKCDQATANQFVE